MRALTRTGAVCALLVLLFPSCSHPEPIATETVPPTYDGRGPAEWAAELREGDAAARQAAVHALIVLGPASVSHLPPLLVTEVPEVLHGALNVAWGLGEAASDPAVVDRIEGLLAADTPRVRARAARALGGIGIADDAAVTRLIALLDDEDQDVRFQAARTLGRVDHEGIPALARLRVMENHDRSIEVRRIAEESVNALEAILERDRRLGIRR